MIISIVIPMFNSATTIESAIRSAENQKHVDGLKREIIVVDDGSTDNGYEVVHSLIETGTLIKLVKQKNSGPAAARNLAVSMSQGDYILPLDADDMVRSDFIQKTLPLMTAGVGFVSTEMQYFGIENDVLPIENVGYEQELHSNTIPVTSLIDRETFLQAGGYQTDVPGWEDWSLWLDILSRGWKMASIKEPLFWYRRRENHFGTTAWDNKIELTKNMRKRHPRFLEGQIDV